MNVDVGGPDPVLETTVVHDGFSCPTRDVRAVVIR